MRFTPTATTPARKVSGPASCNAAAPVFTSEEVSAFTETSAVLLPPVASIVVSFRPAVLFLLILASAPRPWAATVDCFVIPTPTIAVVALDLSAEETVTGAPVLFFLTVVMSVLMISARRFSLPSPLSVPASLPVRATPAPRAALTPCTASWAEPATVVLRVSSVALTSTEAALSIRSRSAPEALFPPLSSPITAMVSLWPRLATKLP